MVWGGLPEKDGLYLPVTPNRNDGATVYKLTVKDVPVDGFWSITVYNADGYLCPNPYNAYSLNNVTAKKTDDFESPCSSAGGSSKTLKLFTDYARLELHGAALFAPAHRSLEWHMEIPGGGAGELSSVVGSYNE